MIRRQRAKLQRLRQRRRIAGTPFTWRQAKAKSWYLVLPPRVKARARIHAGNLLKLQGQLNAYRRRHALPPTAININSWVRSPAKNRYVGGASDSRHTYGDATDITREEVNRLTGGHPEVFDNLADRIFANGGLGTYPAGARHVDSRGSRARWSSF